MLESLANAPTNFQTGAAVLRPTTDRPVVCALLTATFAATCSQAAITNAILFVTQVPMPDERNNLTSSNVAVSVVSPSGNHLADTSHAGRGGDLWIRFPSGAFTNLTSAAGYKSATGATPVGGSARCRTNGPIPPRRAVFNCSNPPANRQVRSKPERN